jgi:glycosyltransferase involved in cell wall biosynthesis
MDVTIVVPVFNRRDALAQTLYPIYLGSRLTTEIIIVNDGSTEEIRSAILIPPFSDLRYIRLDRPGQWKNPGRALNVGLRLAQGEVTIICHNGIVPEGDAIDRLYDAVIVSPDTATLARIEENRQEVSGSKLPYFLLGAMGRRHFQEVRGYDEDFTEYGYEDDDLAVRLIAKGIKFVHRSDILGTHLPHGRHDLMGEMQRMQALHQRKMEQFNRGEIGIVRNLDREWGAE